MNKHKKLQQEKDINLLYAYQKGVKRETTTNKNILIALIAELLIIVVISLFIFFKTIGVKNDIARLNSQIQGYAKIEKEIKDFSNINKLYNEKKQVHDTVAQKNEQILKVITTLERIIPKEMTVQALNINNDSVNIIVKSPGEKDILQFVTNLETSEMFSKVSFSGISTSENYKTTSINAKIIGK